MLDEFTPSHPKPEPKAPSIPSKPSIPPSAEPLVDNEDFAKELQAGMAELMGELESSPGMQAQFEGMLKELGAAAVGEGGVANAAAASTSSPPPPPHPAKAPGGATSRPSTAGGEESFQETIKKTMERMRTSGDQATAAAATDSTDDLLAEMLKAMQAGGLDGEGGEEEFSKMLLGMMEQLTNKDILYEPMKELDDKFPPWMEKNSKTVDAEDLKRYKEQQVYVREIVKRFELKTYNDENAADREYIVERMQKVCSLAFICL